MIVYKFGGTSVGLPERMEKISGLITSGESRKIVVLSAVSGTTNSLVEIGEYLLSGDKQNAQVKIDDLENHYRDFISKLYKSAEGAVNGSAIVDKYFAEIRSLSADSFSHKEEKILLAYGEILSTNLFHCFLNELGVDNTLLSALDFMSIDENKEPEVPKISEKLKTIVDNSSHQQIFITQGFICKNHLGEVDNLQRGGSDYTASLVGAAINATEVQIWTDIDGMHNNDPRVVKQTFPISELTFDEAAELAYFGAKILHPSSILPAQKYGIPVRLKSTINEKAPGTVIGQHSSSAPIKAIAAKDGITAIKIKSTRMLLAYGFLRKVFEVFEKYKTSIDMITTSEVAVSLTIDDASNLESIIMELKSFGIVEIDQNQSIICVVGHMVSDKIGAVRRIFNAIADIPIRMVSYGGSKSNVSILIDSKYKEQALISLNEGIFNLQ